MSQASNEPSRQAATRREFLRKTATAAAAVGAVNLFKTSVYAQNRAPSAGNVIGANSRINVGYVGTGKQGMEHIKLQKRFATENNLRQAAVCDVYQNNLEKAREHIGLDAADTYGDHRKLLERKDIDAIIVATTDPWHAQVSIDGLEAGKHVFCEKPMTRYFE